MTSAKNALEPFREAVAELLVPELQAVTSSIEFLRTELQLHLEAVREEIQRSEEAFRKKMYNSIHRIPEAWYSAAEFQRRLASIEARLSQQ